jgi:hypothetical protein
MITAIDPETRAVKHVSDASPNKAYECQHCGGRVFARVCRGVELAYQHSQHVHNDCIGKNTLSSENWTPPEGYVRPPSVRRAKRVRAVIS